MWEVVGVGLVSRLTDSYKFLHYRVRKQLICSSLRRRAPKSICALAACSWKNGSKGDRRVDL